jgi:NTP pyrophosphatase (non-canonical NTP hydrolase)
MDFNEYQRETAKTDCSPVIGADFVYPVLGMVGEAGEVAEKIKKVFRDGDGTISEEKKQELAKELGDVLWYISRIAAKLGIPFDDIATGNIKKTHSRLERNKLHGDGDNR